MSTLKRTPLYKFHVDHGATFVPFVGWEMPVGYKLGLSGEHKHCRKSALMFDISHMRQFSFTGKDALRFVEFATPADLQALPMGKGRLCWIPSAKSTVIDDCIMMKNSNEEIGMVVNAGCAEKDEKHFRELIADNKSKFGDVELTVHHELSLLALQGPRAAESMSKFVDDLTSMDFMTQRKPLAPKLTGSDKRPVILSRCGYTGEDGFEIGIPNKDVETAANALLNSLEARTNEEDGYEDKGVLPGGLGCRDTLRLEGGMCLYGSEASEDITPMETGLMWQLTKRRREGMLKGEDYFYGCESMRELLKQVQLKTFPLKRRIGLTSKGPCARHGAEIFVEKEGTGSEKQKVGVVTSGSPSVTLPGINVHQAYVDVPYDKPVDTKKLLLQVRNKFVPGNIAKLPFVEPKYYRAPK